MADQILTSEAGRRMLNMVSPIYERSDTAKWLMESMGREIDALKELVTSFSTQITPRTATWSLTMWEEKYGLKAKAGETLENRRAQVLSRMASPGAFTPIR